MDWLDGGTSKMTRHEADGSGARCYPLPPDEGLLLRHPTTSTSSRARGKERSMAPTTSILSGCVRGDIYRKQYVDHDDPLICLPQLSLLR